MVSTEGMYSHFSPISRFPARADVSTPSPSCCIHHLARTTSLSAAACTPPPADHRLPAYNRDPDRRHCSLSQPMFLDEGVKTFCSFG